MATADGLPTKDISDRQKSAELTDSPLYKIEHSRLPMYLSTLIAVFLVLLYAGITINLAVMSFSDPVDDPHPRLTMVYTTVGGLISALAVAVLAVTPPWESPIKTLVGIKEEDIVVKSHPHRGNDTLSQDQINKIQHDYYTSIEKWMLFTAAFYLVVWALCGIVALIVGVLIKPGAVHVLESTGTTWLGIAITAVYAYLGLKPNDRSKDQ